MKLGIFLLFLLLETPPVAHSTYSINTCQVNEPWKTYFNSPKLWFLHLQNGSIISSSYSYCEDELKKK